MERIKLEKLRIKAKKNLKISNAMPFADVDMGSVFGLAFWTAIIGGGLGALFGSMGFGKSLYEQTVEEKTPEIKDAMLKIAQEKAIQYNANMEKYNVSIPVPTSAGELNYDIVVDGLKIKDVSCEAIEGVKQDILNPISDDLIDVGKIKGSVHVGGHNFMLDATSGDALFRPSAGDDTFDAYKFLLEQMGDGFDTTITELANSIAPSTNESFSGGLLGTALGLIPAGSIVAVPLLCMLGSDYFYKRAQKKDNEYKALCIRDGVPYVSIFDERSRGD